MKKTSTTINRRPNRINTNLGIRLARIQPISQWQPHLWEITSVVDVQRHSHELKHSSKTRVSSSNSSITISNNHLMEHQEQQHQEEVKRITITNFITNLLVKQEVSYNKAITIDWVPLFWHIWIILTIIFWNLYTL